MIQFGHVIRRSYPRVAYLKWRGPEIAHEWVKKEEATRFPDLKAAGDVVDQAGFDIMNIQYELVPNEELED